MFDDPFESAVRTGRREQEEAYECIVHPGG